MLTAFGSWTCLASREERRHAPRALSSRPFEARPGRRHSHSSPMVLTRRAPTRPARYSLVRLTRPQPAADTAQLAALSSRTVRRHARLALLLPKSQLSAVWLREQPPALRFSPLKATPSRGISPRNLRATARPHACLPTSALPRPLTACRQLGPRIPHPRKRKSNQADLRAFSSGEGGVARIAPRRASLALHPASENGAAVADLKSTIS